jgi:hypothetical protein
VIRASRPSRAFCADARTMHERRRTEIRYVGGRRDGGQIGGPKEPYHRRRTGATHTVSCVSRLRSRNRQYELPTWGNLTMCVVSHVRRTVKEGIDSLVTNPRSTRHTLVRAATTRHPNGSSSAQRQHHLAQLCRSCSCYCSQLTRGSPWRGKR